MEIVKGNQYSIKVKFTKGGVPATFNNPPMWTLYNSTDIELLSGAANLESGSWVATFTLPTNYVVSGGKERLVVQFSGYDIKNNSFITDKELTLIDRSESFVPNGVIYNYVTDDDISDTIILPDEEASFSIKVYDPYGNQVGTTITMTNEPYSSRNSNGYIFDITIPKLVITLNKYLDPFNIVYKITSASGTNVETHPLYILDIRVMNVVNSLITLLDKSKLVEVDASLMWHDVELVQAVLEGVKRINSSPPEGTFWKIHDFPSPLDMYWLYASAVQALNSRVLAEGLNAFDFTGLNTNLNYNRTEHLTAMIDRLNNFLETLPVAKKSAILINGKGEPAPGEKDLRVKNIGTLGLSINSLNNRIGYNRFRRFY